MNETSRQRSLQIAEFPHDGRKTYYVTAQLGDGSIDEVLGQVTTAMAEREAKIVSQYLFAGSTAMPPSINQLGFPLMLLRGDAYSEATFTSAQFIAVSGVDIHPIMDGDRMVGCFYDTESAKYCFIGDIRSDDLTLGRNEQARAVFEKMEALLRQAGMEFTDTVRTWFYLRNLLEWYGEFNAVRTRFFQERGVFEHIVPASTGIGASSPAGEEIICSLRAVKPKNDAIKILPVNSPLQCPALNYRSSFARAIEIQYPGAQLLTISGTASIDPDGNTAHLGDTQRQIALTMTVVERILQSRGMDWSNTVRAIAYFKNGSEAWMLEKYCADHHLSHLPIAISHADVCRPDLLFELELDAVQSNSNELVHIKKSIS